MVMALILVLQRRLILASVFSSVTKPPSDSSGKQWTAGAEQRREVALKVAPASVSVLSQNTLQTQQECTEFIKVTKRFARA